MEFRVADSQTELCVAESQMEFLCEAKSQFQLQNLFE